MRGLVVVGSLALGLAGAGPMVAQVRGPVYANLTFGFSERRGEMKPGLATERASVGRLLVGGTAGAGLALAATQLAYQLTGGGEICGDDPCGMVAGLTALILLEPILIPAGVHVANHAQGSFAGALFASLVTGAVALYVGSRLDAGEGSLMVIPVIQILTSIMVERASATERGQL